MQCLKHAKLQKSLISNTKIMGCGCRFAAAATHIMISWYDIMKLYHIWYHDMISQSDVMTWYYLKNTICYSHIRISNQDIISWHHDNILISWYRIMISCHDIISWHHIMISCHPAAAATSNDFCIGNIWLLETFIFREMTFCIKYFEQNN